MTFSRRRSHTGQENEPGVRALPKSPKTIGMILIAVFTQSILWSFVYYIVAPALPGERLFRGLVFGMILVVTKMIPRDIDRLLLTSYPKRRMVIEFIIGSVCCICVGVVFSLLILAN
jgi:uncharacterized membrane protein YagU involved in acid resistance